MEKTPQQELNTHTFNKKKLEYLTNNTVILDLPFILTTKKELKIGMPYMMLEGGHTDAVKLLDVWDKDNFVYLKVQDLSNCRLYTVSWNLGYAGDFWLWSLASLSHLYKLADKRFSND